MSTAAETHRRAGGSARTRTGLRLALAVIAVVALTAPTLTTAVQAASGARTSPQHNAGNPGTNSVLPVAGTVVVSNLPNADANPGRTGAPSSTDLAPGRAPTSGVPGAVPGGQSIPNTPTLANSLEQQITVPGLAAADNVAPPDTQVARGGISVMEAVNDRARISLKNGNVQKTFKLGDFYGSVATDRVSDPRVVFDDKSGRWFTTILTVPASKQQNSVFLAVSSTFDPMGKWTIYKLEGPLPSNRLADQARLGFSLDKVIIAFEDFDVSGGCFPSSSCHDDIVWAVEMTDLVAGTSAHATRFNTTSGVAHPFGIVPAIPLSSAETTTAYASYNETHAFGHNVAILVITGLPSAGTTAYSDIETGIAGTNAPPAAHQPGGHQNIDTGDDRFLSASVGRALGGLGAEIWVTGGDKCSVGGNDQACIRALRVQVDSTGTTLTSTWQTDLFAGGSADLYYPAVVGDSTGMHAFISVTMSSATVFPTAQVESIFPAQGSQNSVDNYAAGTEAYLLAVDPNRNNTSRWGDYSGIYPENSTGTSVWVGAEFGAVAGGNWSTAVAEYTIARPVVTGVSPSSGPSGTLVEVSGDNFTKSSFVAFGGVPALNFGFFNSGALLVNAPVQPGGGQVDVTVTTLKGTSALSAADHYTYPAILWSSNRTSHSVTMLDATAGTLLATVFVDGGTATPAGIATLPDDSKALVVDVAHARLVPIDQLTRAAGPSVPTGASPRDVAVRPDGSFAYVTTPKALKPVRVNPNGSLQPLAPIAVAGAVSLNGIAITPDGSRAYVTDAGAGRVWVIALDSKGGGVVAGFIPMDFPTGIAINGTVGFVTLDLGTASPGQLLTFDTGSNSALDSVPVGRDPQRVAVTSTGAFAYVGNQADGTVTAVQHSGPGTDAVIGTVPVGTGPIGVVTAPNGSTVYAALSGAGSIATFPSPPPGPITSFPSGANDPEQLAITTPRTLTCQSNGLTMLLLAVAPANVAGGTPYTEIDNIGMCPGPTGSLPVTVKAVYSAVPTGCTAPAIPSGSWTLTTGQNSRFTQRNAPSCPGSYTLRVQLFDASHTLLATQIVPLQVS